MTAWLTCGTTYFNILNWYPLIKKMHTQFMNAWFQLSCLLRESSGLLNQLMNYFDIPTLVLDTHNSTTYKTMNAWFQLSCLLTYSTIKDFNFRASIWIKISLYVDKKKYKSLISVFSSKSVLIYYEHICWGIATKLSSWLLMYCKYLPNSCYCEWGITYHQNHLIFW